jgi:preprotein translocase subunit SecG
MFLIISIFLVFFRKRGRKREKERKKEELREKKDNNS